MKKNEKHVTEQIRQPEEKKKGKKGGAAKWVALGIVLLILVATAALGLSYENKTGLFSQKLETSFFHLYSPKVPTGKTIRLVTLSDLHNKEFGADNIELVKRVQKLEPDLILIAGDMVNKNEDRTDVAVTLCRQLVEIAPVYYGIGNHEGNMMYVSGLRVDGLLREVGAKVLINQSEDIVVQDTAVSVGSVSTSVLDYDEYSAPFVAEFEQKDTLKILIAHYGRRTATVLVGGLLGYGLFARHIDTVMMFILKGVGFTMVYGALVLTVFGRTAEFRALFEQGKRIIGRKMSKGK